jgi:4-diphosphocytidyl-2-C-methyl-D-erythritol kinase
MCLGRAARAAYQPGTHEGSSISASVSRLSTWVVPAYAKLNLALSVVARRDDGWHDIDSVLVPIDWHDLIGLSLAFARAESCTLTVTGPAAAGVPTGDANLTLRAARALPALARRPLAIGLWLFKDVPHGAGLGGGSADAAAVLRAGVAMLTTLGVATNPDEVAAAALAIGSDIPALLSIAAHRVRGRGELVEPLEGLRLHVAVASTIPSSTAATYAALIPDEIHDDHRSARLADLVASGDTPDPALMGSALEAAACRADPALAAALQRARAVMPAVRWHLTGSGGAVFAVATGPEEAERLASAMRAAGFAARACRTIG